jgi:hypothetical protein
VSRPAASRRTLSEMLERGDEPTRARLRREIAEAGGRLRKERTAEKRDRRERRETELAAKQAALPQKRYGVILADPEWRFEPWSRETGMDRAADNHYPTSDLADIKARDVASIAADDCALFLCATMPMLPAALEVMRAWGFAYKSGATWAKDRVGTGYWASVHYRDTDIRLCKSGVIPIAWAALNDLSRRQGRARGARILSHKPSFNLWMANGDVGRRRGNPMFTLRPRCRISVSR